MSTVTVQSTVQSHVPVTWEGGEEHWVTRGTANEIRLFLWRKRQKQGAPYAGTILFIHGSSMGSQPTFDLWVDGKPNMSVMEYFSARGFDTWCLDNEGYGRASKHRDINFDVANGTDDIAVAAPYVLEHCQSDKLMMYGCSSGALKAALFAERNPGLVQRLALDAFVWTGAGSPTLEQRAKRLSEWNGANRRPISIEFVHSIFNRDHPGLAEPNAIAAFANAILTLDDSVPTGTYVDMCSKLPLVDPHELDVPVMIMRGEFDGIASYDDLAAFFKLLPNPDKQFCMMPGIAHASLQSSNYAIPFHLLHAFFTMPARLR